MTKDYSYSRLGWAEERRLKRKIFFLGGSTVLIIVAFVFWGLPGIPNILSIINWGNSKGVSLKSDSVPPPPPILFTNMVATSSAEMYLTGLSEPSSSIEVRLNGASQPLATASADGTFKSKKLSLTEGNNTIDALAIDEAGNKSGASRPISIVFDKSKPEISLEQPQDGQRFVGSKQQLITVSGKMTKPATLTLNSRFVVVSGDGGFFSQLSLNTGGNTLVLVATDSAGNTTSKQLSVTFEP